MPEKTPGPMCSSRCGPGWVDDGTLCRTRSYAWGPTGRKRSRPRSPTPVHTVHIYANLENDWRSELALGDATFDAAGHAAGKANHVYMRATNLSQLAMVFATILARFAPIRLLDFHTHGRGGEVSIGRDTLDSSNVWRFRNKGFEKMFRAGARIDFHGCNVAEGAEGELLLANFGSIFLKRGGGSVKGSTGAGLASPLYSGNVYHPFGRWVTARVRAGGAVSLVNHRHLHADLIRKETEKLIRHVGAHGRGGDHLREARRYIGGAASKPRYQSVYLAYLHLVAAKRLIATPT